MNLTIFNQLDFLPALYEFFKALQVPINAVTDKPIAARDILESNYKDNESFRLIDEVYFLGTVDDGAFHGKEGKDYADVRETAQNYNGLAILGVALNNCPNGKLPTRSHLAEISRAFSREFSGLPVVVVFKYGEYLAFANTERLKFKRDREGEKAGKVTLLRDIDIRQPHSGHAKILADLKIPTAGKDRVDSFAKLYAYWQKVLDVSLLNKKFYQEVSTWYFYACKQVVFPKDAKDNQESLIRLITRLMFVWFLKEKGLVSNALFDKQEVQTILKSLEPQESTYYKAILQNLFFATLNTEKERAFIRRSGSQSHQYMVHNVFRYEGYFQEPDRVIDRYFANIPFLNGGLFECLDVPPKKNSKELEIRIDGFSDNSKNILSVPNDLFFGDLQDVDLNADFGTSRKKYQVRGLVEIFKSYKFTIAENTPFEEDVALDPELLGQVFENLLAAYNPETQTTARKQTGSFYTPREIVNYMVDESLIAYLRNALPSPPAPLPRGEGSQTLTPPSPQGEGGRGDEGDRLAGKLRLIPKALLIRAKELRQQQTTAEQLLWECLRDRRLCDAKFRRQHNIDRFIADFYCHSAKLVIELDGSVHNSQVEQDQERDAWMRSQGLTVLRFRNQEIFDDLEGVLLRIVEFLPSPPAPLPRGEGSQTLTPPSPQGEGGRGDEGKLRHLLSYTDEPHQFTDSEVECLIRALDNCKILDPACGSGAFPMGVLQKMVHILKKIDPRNERWKKQQREKAIAPLLKDIQLAEQISYEEAREKAINELQGRLKEIEADFANNEKDYPRKLFLIENCIYGVDIQPIALQIAKLRCFIALIVEQKVDDTKPNSNRGILPLPNLETKFVAANSLIRFSDQMNLRSPAVEVLERELKEVRQRHFTARSKVTKDKYRDRDRELRQAIGDLLKGTGLEVALADSLARWNPYNQNTSADFFDAEWMFGIADGFDVVIGNPPYVRQEQIKELKPTLQKQFSCYTGVADLFVYFFERGYQLLNDGGVLSYICSNKYFRSGYGEKLRDFLGKNTTIQQLVDFGDTDVFTAIAYPSIILFSKEKPSPPAPLPRGEGSKTLSARKGSKTLTPPSPQGEGGRGDEGILALTWDKSQPLREFAQVFHSQNFLIPQSELKADGWRLENTKVLDLLAKLRNAGKPLGEYVNGKFYYGIKTGFNEAFVIDRDTRDKLIAEHPSSAEIIKPFLRGRDVKRWRIEYQDLWLIFTRRGIDIKKYPAIEKHLGQYRDRLTAGVEGGRKAGSYQWYEIQDNIAYWQEFEKPKIVYPDIAQRSEFAYDINNSYLSNTLYLLPTKETWLLGLLNSQIVFWFYLQISPKIQGGFVRFIAQYVSQIPIPTATQAEQKAIETLVQKCLEAKGQNVSQWEQEIDQIVARLYGLSDEEMKIIKGLNTD